MLFFISLLLPLSVLAGKFETSMLRARHGAHVRAVQNQNSTSHNVTASTNSTKAPFSLTDFYTGQSFLDDWEFFSAPDPTHGNVNYQTRANAIKKGLAYVQKDGTTILKVDDTTVVPVGGNRDSVRIATKKKYNGGLFIADFWSMPHGCSVWPAYWSVGPNWPAGGEIDVLEGVHEQETNQYTLHTTAGCEIGAEFNEKSVSSRIINDQCASSPQDNSGCAFLDRETQSYGKEFNLIAGGVYAHLWDNTGIKMWRFPRTAIPADITAKKPNPSTWGIPAAHFPSTNCDMSTHFYEHQLILDTTICGDFAGPTYQSHGCPGTCAEAVAKPENYKWAKWQLNYIAVYDPAH